MSWFLANGHLSLCHVIHVFHNEKVDNQVKLGAVHRSHVIYLRVEETPRNPQLRDWATSQTANVGEHRINPGMRILPLPSANGHFGWRMSGRSQRNLFSVGWESILEDGWTTGWPKTWRPGRETGILHIIIFPGRTWNFTLRKKRIREYFISIHFHKSGPDNKHQTYKSISQSI